MTEPFAILKRTLGKLTASAFVNLPCRSMTDVPASVRDTLFSPEKATFALVYSALEDAKL